MSTTADIDRPRRFDFAGTLQTLCFPPGTGEENHGGDPTVRLSAGTLWRATRTPEGPATIRLVDGPDTVTATAWGPGAGWLLARAGMLAGLADDPAGFAELAAGHPALGRLAASRPGLRLVRTERVFEELIRAVLGQRVTTVEATRAYRALVRRFGGAAPGPVPAGLLVPPDPAVLAAAPYWEWHPLGVERRRAETLRHAAGVAGRLEALAALPPDEAQRRMCSLPGVGVWTAAEVARVAFGDPDAVSVGDFHLPTLVARVLDPGLPEYGRADDARMLELLAPFAGHRGRVAQLVITAGPPTRRRAPRAPIRSFARY